VRSDIWAGGDLRSAVGLGSRRSPDSPLIAQAYDRSDSENHLTVAGTVGSPASRGTQLACSRARWPSMTSVRLGGSLPSDCLPPQYRGGESKLPYEGSNGDIG
jgi:hypothetical protein